jgi:hypothetical protein
MSMKNSSDTIRNRTHDLPVCSAVPQPTAPPHAPTKPTRCINFSNLFLEWNSTCFWQLLCPSSVVFHCPHSNGICHTGLLTASELDQDGTSWSCLQAVSKLVWHIPLLCGQWKTTDDGQSNCQKHVEFHSKNKFEKLMLLVVPSWSSSLAVSKHVWLIPLLCVHWKTTDDGQRNCPKHVEFHSKNKSEKLMNLVGFIIRNFTRCTVTWTSNSYTFFVSNQDPPLGWLKSRKEPHFLRGGSFDVHWADRDDCPSSVQVEASLILSLALTAVLCCY